MIDQIVIVIYLLILLGIGIYFARKQKSEDSFFLASRNLGTVHVVASILSTVAGAGTMFMVAALGYTYGVSVIWFFVSGLIGFIIFSLAIPKIKNIADENDCITLPELLKTKLDRKAMVVSSLITIVIFGGFIAVNFLAAGTILQIAFDVPLIPVVVGFALLITLYSLLGGFKAVVWTDVVQAVIILLGLGLILALAIKCAGGFSALSLLPPSHKSLFGMGSTLIIGMFLSTILAYFSSQDIYQRIFAAKSVGVAKRSAIYMGILIVFVGLLVMFLGVFGKVLFPDISANQLLPMLTTTLAPVGLVGFILAAYLAMANSTADSELLTVTSNIMRDFFGRKKTRLSPTKEVFVSRIIVVIVAIVALILALSVRNITDIVLALYTWLGILGLNVIAILFWKRTKSNAVFWSLIFGFGLAILYTFFTGDFESAMLVGLIPAALILFVGSYISKH